ncbi:Malate-2H(+)/Na(+)-lactate antiporter [BD1-7 clade bacterium]|uniref:Malate-2H(+)/Na(+)-lactate antiporter n=1 Tax=BD1-7 clade bacterium TaxID=2029982 RepID=A0A5S9QGD3_9GAMM|nr:Malate-2H(+)/Na(+)-lactate antiporter [BD1-7 clade bacterium]
MHKSPRAPSLLQALLPLSILIALLGLSVYFFGDDASSGANQIALLLAAGAAALVGLKNGYRWDDMEKAIIEGISVSMIAILILLCVGALIGTWLLSGTVQTLIYYGLLLINPDYFLFTACIVCAVTALCIGSSWTVAGTLGIAFMGMAQAMGLSAAMTAGAVISGAYFGDKLSPLSDTTNLASAVTGVNLFEHIRYMLWTTLPSFAIALAGFLWLGMGLHGNVAGNIVEAANALKTNYTITPMLLIPMLLVFIMAWRRMPALPTIFIGALIGGVFAVFYQKQSIGVMMADYHGPEGLKSVVAVWQALARGFVSHTTSASLNELLSRGGMSSMLPTVWLILCAMTFGSVMEKVGLLQSILHAIARRIESVSVLIVTTLFTCISANIVTSDQYIAIVLPGRMFRLEYEKHRLAGRMLSRTLEDSATLTSALVPWNTCGAYMAATLGVATFTYLPFAFFNWVGPLVSALYAITRFRLAYLDDESASISG